MRKSYEKKYEPFGGKTRHRAFLWGPSAVYYTDFPTWIQNCWGINIVLNMDSTMGHNMISTDDPEQAIQDLALFSEKGVTTPSAAGTMSTPSGSGPRTSTATWCCLTTTSPARACSASTP